MTETSSDKDTNVSLTHLQASRYPLMRRLDQQFALETKLSDYQKEISRVRDKNKIALSSLGCQERRLREMQALLRSSSSIQTKNVTNKGHLESTGANITTPNHDIRNTVQKDTVTDNDQLGRLYANHTTHNKEHNQSIVDEGKRQQWTTTQTAVNADSDRAIVATKTTGPQTSIREKTTNETSQVTCVPDAPTNFLATEIRQNSFAVQWDVINHDRTIIDYEVRYSFSAEGKEKQVLHSCSRWCMTDPVPNGRFVIQNLEPNTEYRSITIRRRNHVGWSEFSDPIQCLTAAPKGEKSVVSLRSHDISTLSLNLTHPI